jgi:hypothetical protein
MFSYSFNEENYHGEFDSVESAIKEAKADRSDRPLIVFIGENRVPDVMLGIDGNDILESIAMTEDFSIEQAEGWPGATKEQIAQLTAKLRETFQAWMESNGLTPKFWLVENVRMHTIEEVEEVPS